uniref:Major capsid protein N-terminal domain-containing protein n=1 Tax=viral metagenome TaxID=1070528 RepID=A0A6C0HLL2_9ZZZZ
MTAGSLIALEYGNVERMAFLTLNPQITHFKSVYKKHTNFATQFITEMPDYDTQLQSNSEKRVTFAIPRNGDAIRDMYLTFELPDIYSSGGYNFQWIKRIAEYLVKSVSIQMDNAVIDTHYSEWFHAHSELFLNDGHKKGYYKMIGNVPELYDPTNAPGNNGIYPQNANFPSIVGRKLYLPLTFWFNKYASMVFPLIAVQKAIVSLTFTFRRLQELYTVIDVTGSQYRVRPYLQAHFIGNFLNAVPVPIISAVSSLNIHAKLEVNYIFLDNEERKRFALQSHDYLINQIQVLTNPITTSSGVQINMQNLNKPITQLIWMIRRTDMEDVNDWSNFTNWNVPDIPPFSIGYINPYGPAISITPANLKYYKTKNLLKSAVLRLMTYEITSGTTTNFDTGGMVDGKDSVFFNLMENFNCNANMPDEGIYTYSFALDNSSLQPTGSVNFSTINNKDMLLNLTEIAPTGYNGNTYNYNIRTFAVNYDILKVLGGMVATMTSN